MKSAMVIGALAFASLSATAQESKWGLVAAVGWADGGDEIFAGQLVDVSNPAKVTDFNIKTAKAVQLRVGPEYRFNDRFSVQATVGRSVSDPMGVNASLTFTTTPVEVIANVKALPNVMIGIGGRKTFADLKGTGIAANYPILGSYDSSGGAVLEFKYLFSVPSKSSQFNAALGAHARFVSEKFTFQKFELNGNHYELGLTLHY